MYNNIRKVFDNLTEKKIDMKINVRKHGAEQMCPVEQARQLQTNAYENILGIILIKHCKLHVSGNNYSKTKSTLTTLPQAITYVHYFKPFLIKK